MKEVVTPYNSTDSKKQQVALMFNNIARRYDFLNHFLSMGIDRLWRRKAIKLVKNNKPEYILDVATGTGDFAIEALSLKPKKITGVDISVEMLKIGEGKIRKRGLSDLIELKQADSENLPFPDNSFDLITVAFGARNFENLSKGLSEMYRVLKPNGSMVILEFSKPRSLPVKILYNFYFSYLLPFFGRIISKDDFAYNYLPESVKAFPEGNAFMKIIEDTGFKKTLQSPLTFGIASIYLGRK